MGLAMFALERVLLMLVVVNVLAGLTTGTGVLHDMSRC